MSELMRMIVTSAQGTAARQGHSTVERIEHIVLLTIAAAASAATAVLCGMAAIWIYAVPYVGPVGASLIVAVLFAAMSGIFLIVRHYTIRPHPTPDLPAPAPMALLTEATHMLREHKGLTLLAAALTGLELGLEEKK